MLLGPFWAHNDRQTKTSPTFYVSIQSPLLLVGRLTFDFYRYTVPQTRFEQAHTKFLVGLDAISFRVGACSTRPRNLISWGSSG